ncbi:unnamed protein product [Paramecium sonneborni]|uniref:Uncharacterized protein n=1 Tax=Paramecium sonneborni TaxID=65129 RepID=A0A8S1NSU2_9CILI|nr:unnamed protein product [Paramecium sonneborni]
MYLHNNSNQRSQKNRIFDSPNTGQISLSRDLSTNFTPVQYEESQKNYIKTSQFSLNTSVNQSIQETQFQQPIQAEIIMGIQNTPQFFKQHNIIRRELGKYINESGQLKIDEGQSEDMASSEESLNSIPQVISNFNNFERKVNKKQQFYPNNTLNQQEHPLKVSDLKSEPILRDTQIQEYQLESSNSSQRINQNIFTQQKIQEDQKSPESIQSMKNDNQESYLSNPQQINQQSFDQSNISQWSIEQIEILIQGIQITKYSRKTLFGKKKRLLQVSPDLKLLVFRNLEHKITKIYSINKITKIEKGANTETFRLYKPKSDILWLCFSIFLDERTVDLSVQTQEQLSQIIDSLYGLIQKN